MAEKLPHKIKVQKAALPLAGGVKLDLQLFLPQVKSAVPVVVELAAHGDEKILRHLAGHGFAALRVVGRKGEAPQPFSKAEEDEILETLAFATRQKWCDGTAGLMGFGHGGTMALQVAARGAPALKALIAVAAVDDRYDAAGIYRGGVLQGSALTGFAKSLARLSLDGKPAFEMAGALAHPARDAFWAARSPADNAGQITTPTMLICGWDDAAAPSQFRLMKALRSPRKAVIGPWGHEMPLGLEAETLRWFDYQLRGASNGVALSPQYRFWMNGRWIGDNSWGLGLTNNKTLYLSVSGLSEAQGLEKEIAFSSALSCGFGPEARDDAQSLTFDSPPLAQDLVLTGTPEVNLDLAADKPEAQVFVRLSAVAQTGEVTTLSSGQLNLTQRTSRGAPMANEPGRRYRVNIKLDDLARLVPQGNRLRVSLATSHFPKAWPDKDKATLTVFTGASELHLPTRQDSGSSIEVDLKAQGFAMPQAKLAVDAKTDALRLERTSGDVGEVFNIAPDDPLSASQEVSVKHSQGKRRAEVNAKLRGDKTHWHLSAMVEIFEGKKRITKKAFSEKVARKFE